MNGGDAHIKVILAPVLTPHAECFPGASRGYIQEIASNRKTFRTRRKGLGDLICKASDGDTPNRDGSEVQQRVPGNRVGRSGEEVHG